MNSTRSTCCKRKKQSRQMPARKRIGWRLNYTMTPHESLTQVRRTLLDLHKALIERERAAYEKGTGP
jgi:hypothetical protein